MVYQGTVFSGFVWVTAGCFRNWRGLAAAIAATWFGLPLAVLYAVLFGILGMILFAVPGSVGWISTPDFSELPGVGDGLGFAEAEVGTIVGALQGALAGTLYGFWLGIRQVWAPVFERDVFTAVVTLVGQFLVGLFCGVVYVLYAVVFERWRLGLRGARRMSRREAAYLVPILRDCVDRAGLPATPQVLMEDRPEPTAYAVTRHIVVSTGLLEEFGYDTDVVAAVLSHELTHWANADAVSDAMVRGASLPLYLIYIAANRVRSWNFRINVKITEPEMLRPAANPQDPYGPRAEGRSIRFPLHTFIKIVLWAIAWPIMVTVRFFVLPVQATDLRASEYRADQGAVAAGHRDALRIVLARLRTSFDQPTNGWEDALYAAHPPTELRLEKIEDPGRQYILRDSRREALVSGHSPGPSVSSLHRD